MILASCLFNAMIEEIKKASHVSEEFVKGWVATANIQIIRYMAYNSRNLLLKIIAIQELVIAGQKRGATQKWVYENEVKDTFFIGYSTFNNYLAVNAKRELEILEKKLAEKQRQLSIW